MTDHDLVTLDTLLILATVPVWGTVVIVGALVAALNDWRNGG